MGGTIELNASALHPGTEESATKGFQTAALAISAIGILSNGWLITQLHFRRRERWSPGSDIMTNIAIFNIVWGVLQGTKSTLHIRDDLAGKIKMCAMFGRLTFLMLVGSTVNHTLSAFNHYAVTFHSKLHKQLFTRRKTAVFIFTTWLVIVASWAYIKFVMVNLTPGPRLTTCDFVLHKEYSYPAAAVLLAALIFAVFVDFRIYRAVKLLLKRNTDERVRSTWVKRLRSVRGLLAVTVWLVLTYMAGLLEANLVRQKTNRSGYRAVGAIFLLLLTNQVDEPLLYVITERQYTNKVSRILRRLLHVAGRRRRRVGAMNVMNGNSGLHLSLPGEVAISGPR